MKKDVMFYEAFDEEAEQLKRFLPPSINASYTPCTIQEYTSCKTPPASIISLRTQSIIPETWAPSLNGILTRSTGYDHIIRYLAQTNAHIPSGYLPLYCARAVAEQAMLLWMALLRKLPQQLSHFDTFHRDGLTGAECAGKKMMVVGIGNIGYEIVSIAKGLQMDVMAVDIEHKYDDISYWEPEKALPHAQIIVSAMNLTTNNEKYFSYELFKKTRGNVLFINIARGELAPSTELLRALNDQLIAGIGLDVYNEESELAISLRTKKTSTHPEVAAALELKQRPKVLLTPHNAFNTHESVERKSEQSIQQLEYFIQTGAFIWPVP